MINPSLGSMIQIAAQNGKLDAVALELLRRTGLSEVRVLDYTPLLGGNPVMSQVFRIRITGSGGIPRSVIMKLPAKSPVDRARESANGSYQREIEVYRMLSDMQGGFQPRILSELFDPDTGNAALLIEDLGRLPSRHEFTIGVVRDALAGLAEVHARFWGDSELGAASWMRDGYRADIFNEDTSGFSSNWEALSTSTSLHPCNHPIVNEVGSYLSDHLLEVLDELDARPCTLTHGDLHTENMMLRRNGATVEPVLIDWQDAVYSGATSDVAKFLATTLSPEIAEVYFEELIDFYYRALNADVRTDYAFSSFRRDVMLALLGTFANYVICATTEIAEGVDTSSVNRSLKSVSAVINVVRPLDAL
ncbi:MAG: phosphotransferase [Chloroflexi bacterium]|nr:phosphotransferase [Chloroflexota bacterium]